MQRTILLVRHPEARKNVEDRHGGEGTDLTERGIHHCEDISRYVINTYSPLDQSLLVGHNAQQVRDTVERLGALLGIKPLYDQRLVGLNFGALSGLSRAEAMQQWPDAALRLELWRQGQLRIDELNIPQGEDLIVFKNRVESLLRNWIEMPDINLIIAVCTTSTLIMLVNLIELGALFSYQLYKVKEFNPGSITKVEFTESQPRIVIINQIEHLSKYP